MVERQTNPDDTVRFINNLWTEACLGQQQDRKIPVLELGEGNLCAKLDKDGTFLINA